MTEKLIKTILQFGTSVVGKVIVKSALNPILWLSAISTPIFIIAGFLCGKDESFRGLFFYASLVPFSVALIAYVGFALLNADRLHSEEFQLKRETLKTIQQNTKNKLMDPQLMEGVSNPLATLPETILDKEDL